MLYMATISFSGLITMRKGEVREISDQSLIDDLMKAGYIIPYEATNKNEPKDDVKTEKKTKRKGKTNED